MHRDIMILNLSHLKYMTVERRTIEYSELYMYAVYTFSSIVDSLDSGLWTLDSLASHPIGAPHGHEVPPASREA